MSLQPIDNHAHHPPGVVTTPEATNTDGRTQGAAVLGATAGVGLLAAPPTRFFKTIAKMMAGRFGMMLLCSIITSFIFKSETIVSFGRIVCTGIGKLGDAAFSKKLDVLLDKGGEVVSQQTAPATDDSDGDKPKPTIKERFKGVIDKGKEATKQVAHDTGEAIAQKVKPIENDARQAVDDIKDRLGPARHAPDQFPLPPLAPQQPQPALNGGMGGVPLQPIGPPQTFSGRAGQFVANAGNSMTSAARSFSSAAAEQALYLEWWAEACPYNGRCPNPKCHKPMKIGPLSKAAFSCKLCGWKSRGDAIRAVKPAPPPVKPPQFYAWMEEREKKQAQEEEAK